MPKPSYENSDEAANEPQLNGGSRKRSIWRRLIWNASQIF